MIDGAVVPSRWYGGDPAIECDRATVERAIAMWTASPESAAAYGIDFGVLADGRTALVELNDGYGVGAYGLDDETYVNVLVGRWTELVGTQQAGHPGPRRG